MTTKESIIKISSVMEVRQSAIWNLYYETGIDYLEQLKQRISNYNYLKLQFGDLLANGSIRISPEATFLKIEYSPIFWEWWAKILLEVCVLHKPKCCTELSIRAIFVADLIPQLTLSKIITNDTQKGKPNRLQASEKRNGEKTASNVLQFTRT